jgi:large subunit ribosomal protein L19
MKNHLIQYVEDTYLKKTVPQFRVGDTVRVDVRVIEGESERVQAFEGVVLKKNGNGVNLNFTVRKISYGIGIERTFPMHSPRIDNIKVMKQGKVRRARLYYLRGLAGKAARIEEQESVESPAKPAAPKPAGTDKPQSLAAAAH